MSEIVINDVFKRTHLISGVDRDNFIFCDCPHELIEQAEKSLKESHFYVKACIVKITGEDEKKFLETISPNKNKFQRTVFARAFVTSLVLNEVLKCFDIKQAHRMVIEHGIKNMLSGDSANHWKVKQYYQYAPFPSEIDSVVRKHGKIEVDFMLVDTESELIQRAVNNFISVRTPYAVKVFTTRETLPSYVDERETRIECPHDYMTVNVKNFVTRAEDRERK